MRAPTGRRRRAAFTLLEVMLASVMALLIMYGLYLAINTQLKFADSGRSEVEAATLARSLVARIHGDVMPGVGQPDPSRYLAQGNGQNQSGGAGGSTPGGSTPGGSGGTPTTPATTGSTPGTTGATGSTPSSTSPSTTGQTTTTLAAFVGDETSIQVFISRVPRVLTGGVPPADAPPESDQRVVQYWLADNGGLCRQELVVSTTATDIPWAKGTGSESNYLIAPEVTRLEYSFWDGTTWNDTWDSTEPGSDGMTPLGPPMAIGVKLEIKTPGPSGGKERVRTYFHIINIPTANGLPQSSSSSDGTPGNSTGNSPGNTGGN